VQVNHDLRFWLAMAIEVSTTGLDATTADVAEQLIPLAIAG
jgi:hypothetical protein